MMALTGKPSRVAFGRWGYVTDQYHRDRLADPYVERLIGTLRRDCLDHVLIFGARHLRQILTSYCSYYNQSRTHLSLDKDAPLQRTVPAMRDNYPRQFCPAYIINTRGYDFREDRPSRASSEPSGGASPSRRRRTSSRRLGSGCRAAPVLTRRPNQFRWDLTNMCG